MAENQTVATTNGGAAPQMLHDTLDALWREWRENAETLPENVREFVKVSGASWTLTGSAPDEWGPHVAGESIRLSLDLGADDEEEQHE